MWVELTNAPGTFAMEVPGCGVVVRYGEAMVHIPGARMFNGRVVLENRSQPPLAPGQPVFSSYQGDVDY